MCVCLCEYSFICVRSGVASEGAGGWGRRRRNPFLHLCGKHV